MRALPQARRISRHPLRRWQSALRSSAIHPGRSLPRTSSSANNLAPEKAAVTKKCSAEGCALPAGAWAAAGDDAELAIKDEN
jgi:hypothetical protein